MKTLEEKTYQQKWDELSLDDRQNLISIIREVVDKNLITSLIWDRLSDILLICQMIKNETLMIPALDEEVQNISLNSFEHGNYILQIVGETGAIASQIIPQVPSQFVDYEIEVPERVEQTLKYCSICASGMDFIDSIHELSDKVTALFDAFDMYEGLKDQGVDILK